LELAAMLLELAALLLEFTAPLLKLTAPLLELPAPLLKLAALLLELAAPLDIAEAECISALVVLDQIGFQCFNVLYIWSSYLIDFFSSVAFD
jgi:hypothetical protein